MEPVGFFGVFGESRRVEAMEPVGFFGIFEESRRIISAHSRHFLGLSVLFLLPIAFLTCAASTFRSWIDIKESHEELLSSKAPYNLGESFPFFVSSKETKVTLFLILYCLLMLVLALCSNAAVTYSTCNGFFGRGVKLPGAIRSIPGSAWRLLATATCGLAIIACVSFAFGFTLSICLLALSVFHVSVQSSTWIVYVASWIFAGLVGLYLQIHWILAPVLPVVEGSWGLEPLRRSGYLVRGMRWVSLWLILFFGISGVVLALWAQYLQSSASDSLDLLSKIVQSITVLGAMTLWFLYNIATNTVLYMYCKVYHNELLDVIMEEFVKDSVILPFDYQKIPQLVSVHEQP